MRLVYFLYAFAIWDIFYYVFLKLALNWPASLLTWDLLFLIPWPWAGPVITPIICCALFITLAVLTINLEDDGITVKINAKEWALMIAGILLVLYSWVFDYGKIIIGGGYAKDFFTLATNEEFMQVINNYIPHNYNWPVFLIGIAFILIGALVSYFRIKKIS